MRGATCTGNKNILVIKISVGCRDNVDRDDVKLTVLRYVKLQRVNGRVHRCD